MFSGNALTGTGPFRLEEVGIPPTLERMAGDAKIPQ
jgi:hypothetical protein